MCRICRSTFPMTWALLVAAMPTTCALPITKNGEAAAGTKWTQTVDEVKPLPEGVLLWLVSRAAEGKLSSFVGVAYSPDGKMLAICGSESLLRLLNAETGTELHRLPGGLGTNSVLAFSPNGKLLVSAGQDKTVRLWDSTSGKEIGALKGHTAWIRSLAFSCDGKTLATGDQDKAIRVWDVSSRQQICTLTGCNGRVTWLSFSPDGKALASASEDEKVRLWELDSGKEIRAWEGERNVCVAFSPTSFTLAMTGKEGTPWVRDAATGKVLHRLDAGPSGVRSIAYSPDGRFIAGGGSNELFYWEAATGKLVLRIRKDFSFGSRHLAFSPDGRALATAGGDESLVVWDLTGWGKRQPPQGPDPTPDELTVLWADLLGEDAAKAYRAIWSLVAVRQQALALLKGKLRREKAETEQAQQWIAQLDDDQFPVRQKATAELEKMGAAAGPALRGKLAEELSGEMRRRIESLLDKLDAPQRRVRLDRTLAVLEHMGTPEALEFLKSLASGSPDIRQTQEAKAALDRLAKRAALRPWARCAGALSESAARMVR